MFKLTSQGQSSERNGYAVTCQEQVSLEGTFLINDEIFLRKNFEIFKKD